jgi:hypothetical protein
MTGPLTLSSIREFSLATRNAFSIYKYITCCPSLKQNVPVINRILCEEEEKKKTEK